MTTPRYFGLFVLRPWAERSSACTMWFLIFWSLHGETTTNSCFSAYIEQPTVYLCFFPENHSLASSHRSICFMLSDLWRGLFRGFALYLQVTYCFLAYWGLYGKISTNSCLLVFSCGSANQLLVFGFRLLKIKEYSLIKWDMLYINNTDSILCMIL